MDLEKIILEGAERAFALEIFGRTVFMFLLILIVLRLSGRRGVRQLTLFEVAIIIGLGSAAGDPMFQEDIPIIYSAIVLFSVILFYKVITFAAGKSRWLTRLLEGEEMVIVEGGKFKIAGNKKADFSQMEFFAELRNQSIEHLGQVRMAVLEIDGTISILKYDNKNVRYGLPLFPGAFKPVQTIDLKGPYACMYCGTVEEQLTHSAQPCSQCGKQRWTIAINTEFIM